MTKQSLSYLMGMLENLISQTFDRSVSGVLAARIEQKLFDRLWHNEMVGFKDNAPLGASVILTANVIDIVDQWQH